MYRHQIGRNSHVRRTLVSKANELWVTAVAFSLAEQDCLSKKALPPNGQQPLPVQITRMDSPESHVTFCPMSAFTRAVYRVAVQRLVVCRVCPAACRGRSASVPSF